MNFDDLSRQRIDFSEGPNGETIAVLTLTLQDGSVHRFRESVTEEEIESLGAALASAEVRAQRTVEGEEIAGLFDFVKKAASGIANVAKKVVTSKVFKAAGTGLTMAAPALGPFAPAALAVGTGMTAASKLTTAALAAKAGAKNAAKILAGGAKSSVAKVLSNPSSQMKLLRIANVKRKNAEKLAEKKGAKRRERGRERDEPRKKPNVLAAAKAGRLRSNKAGAVSASSLERANREGRVFWIAA